MLQSADVQLKDAEEKQLADKDVRTWLHDPKEVIFLADEVTDKIHYDVSRHKLEPSFMRSTFSRKSVEKDMESILAHLEDVLKRNDYLRSRANEHSLKSRVNVLSLTSRDVDESEVYDRNDDKEAIMKLMLSDEDCGDKIRVVIPIVGMDGIGKTTLAQLVYNDQRVKKHFEIRVWVTVSTECAVLNITKLIFEQVKSKAFGNNELSLLQGELKEDLETKKFLFVLDGVWNEDLRFWDQLKPLFKYGASGSKIIITTSSSTVAEIAVDNKRGEIYHLRVLKDSFCGEFFSRRAFKNQDLNSHPDLLEIGKKIVQKCQGLPLALKYFADSLGSLSVKEWRRISDGQLQEITSKYILPALWLSYCNLSLELKRCFAYCSIFPKYHEFCKKEVILLWMAEGLLQTKNRDTMEDVGDYYFKTLTSRSFFQPVESKSSFIMHSCIHDLAKFVLGDFGFRLEENDLNKLPERVRHLSVMKKYIRDLKQFEGLFKAKFLRTFLTLEFNRSSQHMVPLQELLRKEEWLRVVSLSHYISITELPDSVGKLKHLRYLDLSFTAISEIPSTICSLYNLETFLLKYCRNLTRLPDKFFGRLLNLRHFNFDGSGIKCEFPPEIGKLTDLQTLSRFIVCKKKGRSRIDELGDLNQLRGKFEIWGLENVVDVENVSKAKLSEKKSLTRLGLYWDGDSAGSSVHEKHREVLDRLQPHTQLKTLYISGYNGENFSHWMGDQAFCNMVRVDLVKCRSNSLFPIEQLPSLKTLCISRWPVETLSLEFNSNGSSMTEPFKCLEDLLISDMPELKECLFTDNKVFPCLKRLQFEECPKLDVRLPDCFPALTKLVVRSCRRLQALIGENTGQGSDGEFSSLKELEIFECPEQMSFSGVPLPSSLNKMKIYSRSS